MTQHIVIKVSHGLLHFIPDEAFSHVIQGSSVQDVAAAELYAGCRDGIDGLPDVKCKHIFPFKEMPDELELKGKVMHPENKPMFLIELKPGNHTVNEFPEFVPGPAVPAEAVDVHHPHIHAGTLLTFAVTVACCFDVEACSHVDVVDILLRPVYPFNVTLQLRKPRFQPVP